MRDPFFNRYHGHLESPLAMVDSHPERYPPLHLWLVVCGSQLVSSLGRAGGHGVGGYTFGVSSDRAHGKDVPKVIHHMLILLELRGFYSTMKSHH